MLLIQVTTQGKLMNAGRGGALSTYKCGGGEVDSLKSRDGKSFRLRK